MKKGFTEAWVTNRRSRSGMTNILVLICLSNQEPQSWKKSQGRWSMVLEN
jgi:hypothetical protein